MTIAYRILNNSDELHIEFGGQIYAEDTLCESLWLVNIELRGGLPKREQIHAKKQIAQYETLLNALREARAGA